MKTEKPSKDNIWNFKQNKPSYIVDDICLAYPEVPREFVYEVLLKRGAFKWFAVRRDLIKLKNEWREDLRDCYAAQTKKKTQWRKGFLWALNECRESVRQLCHSTRWRAPDFDQRAQRYLEKLERENG